MLSDLLNPAQALDELQQPTLADLSRRTQYAQASVPMFRATILPNGTSRVFSNEIQAREWINLMGAKPGAGATIQVIKITPR